MDKKRLTFILMFVLVFMWGLDYSVAKNALEVFRPLNLMFFKYLGGLIVITAIKVAAERRFTVRKKDIIFFVLCSLTGQVLYYFCEYTAMEYIPVALITIILSFVPIISILIERVFFKTKMSVRIITGLVVCVIGVGLVIGADFKSLFSGRALGYLLAFGAVISWNMYNFITARISRTYTELTMAFDQLLCTVLISLPYAAAVMPPAEEFTPQIILSLVYLGVGSAGTGYIIYVRGVKYLGPTISSLFSNFLPVTSTFFGWLILGQSLGVMQIAGGMIVIVSACYVIIEKSRLQKQELRLRLENEIK